MTERDTTYAEDFPIGSRVRVHAPRYELGSDHEHHGRDGTVESHGMWFAVRMNLLQERKPAEPRDGGTG